MKNIVRLTLVFTAVVILFLFYKTEPTFPISNVNVDDNSVVLPRDYDFLTDNSSHLLRLDDVVAHCCCYMMNNDFLCSSMNNVSNFRDDVLCAPLDDGTLLMNQCSSLVLLPPPPLGLVLLQCPTSGAFFSCSELILKSSEIGEASFLRSRTTTTTSVDSSCASASISKSVTLRNVILALLLLMMPRGAHDFDVGSDEEGDSDDDNDDDDDSSSEGDVLVYTYEEDVNRPQNQGNFAFLTNVAYTTTWKDVADSLHEDFILQYNLEGNNDISGNPRLCCYGYFARYFQYANPRAEIDIDEPLQEFSPDEHDWLYHVKPLINRINLYRMCCNGF